ncbi:MAG: ATP-binding protein [Myxococcales bacterium]|jgi:signal transduction histidine kinase
MIGEDAIGAPGEALKQAPGGGFTRDRLAWLIELRWLAVAGIVIAAALTAAGAFPGVNWQVLTGTAAGVAVYNFILWRELRAGRFESDRPSAIYQALFDFLTLTVVLWAAGGLDSPFISFYVFHVALVGILSGPRATLLAAGMALSCCAILWLTELIPGLRIGEWQPEGLWHPVSNVVAFVATVGAVAYLVVHAVAELHDRERALDAARQRAELEYELLSNTLNELDAGLEVLDGDHVVVWRNRLARRLVPRLDSGDAWHCPGHDHQCERDASGLCPIHRSFQLGEAGRCRFAMEGDGPERVYELHSFPLSSGKGGGARVMNLYLDRTGATLAERQLVLAERLASLGRVAQGVAHELNTPLATIRTLATDMAAALRELERAEGGEGGGEGGGELVRDVSESASLIREETARLGRITHSLLAGGDLVRLRIVGAVSLAAVAERAAALVFAGVREGPTLAVDPSLDEVRVRCDQDRLVQILVNLLQNAHDALSEGRGGTVRIRAELDGEGGVRIFVDDDGPGLDGSVQGRLFEPFTTTKPPGRGTGLGLYTSYMLAKAMHGRLALLPRPGGGTRAEVWLPLDSHAAGDQPEGEVAHG